MKAKDLAFAPYNPRKITDGQLEALGRSMHKFGELGCIVWNEATERVVGGHQRLKHVPPDAPVVWTEEYDEPDGQQTTGWGYIDAAGERWLVRRVRVEDEATEIAMNIAANKHGGEFDIPLLTPLLSDLDAEGFDMDLTGFGEDELRSLLATTMTLGVKDAEDSFASGDQFGDKRVIVIAISYEQANDAQLRIDLQAFCDKYGLTFDIKGSA